MTLCESFPPAGAQDPVVVILGTMPGPASLRKGQYYAHPHNAFWKIMGDLFGAYQSMPYEDRLQILAQKRITLFETLRSCMRPGSADSAMSETVPNDFNAFFAAHPNATHIFFDGRAAFDIFHRQILPTLAQRNLCLVCLPSTSPRNARQTYGQKLDAWRIIKDLLQQESL